MSLLALLACSDHVLSTKTPDVTDASAAISVAPDHLDFWTAGVGEVVVLPFTVYSVGEAALRVASITLEGDGSFTLPYGGDTFDLLPGEAREVPVAFAPMEPGDQLAEAVVLSDDPEAPEVRVPLSGGGEVPYLVVTPDPHDFGTLPVGCSDTVELVLQNVGTDTLEVASWSHDGAGFSVRSDVEPPFEVEPYDYRTVTVTFAPAAAGDVVGALSVVSNDPRGAVVATQTGAALSAGTGADRFTSEVDPPVDIVLAVDQSASMDDGAASLAASFETFIATLGAVTSGWHLGVATLDSGCFNGGVLTSDRSDLAPTFAAAVAEGDDRDIVYDEALFQTVDAALRETAPGGCNEGFLRDGAPLHLVFVSDEPERSTESAAVWTWDWYLARWLDYVVSDTLLVASGIVDTEGCGEGDDGYAELVAATGGDALSICAPDWAAALSSIAARSTASAWTFALSETPVPASIVVAVDGAAWSSGWSYDAAQNAVVMEGLAPGQDVEVTYDLATECL